MASCPICGLDAKPRAKNEAFPFCSPRCRTIDLGKWLSEDYRIPVPGSDGADVTETMSSEAEADSRTKRDMRN